MRATSAKRRRENTARRAALLAHYGPSPSCEAGPILAAAAAELRRYRRALELGATPPAPPALVHPQAVRHLLEHVDTHACKVRAADAHEVLTRARGGSITDPANIIPVCRPCHRLITTEPALADALELTRPSEPRR